MLTKYNYNLQAGQVNREFVYSFTPYEELKERLVGMDNTTIINNIINTTLKGEAERELISIEDEWFKVQDEIQQMKKNKKLLEESLNDSTRMAPLTPDEQKNILAQIADKSEGTVTVEKEFYDHYTRQTHKVKEIHQTTFTKKIEKRNDIESKNNFLAGYRGVEGIPGRPTPSINPDIDKRIKLLLVRKEIDMSVGDEKDLIADLSKAVNVILQKLNGQELSETDQTNLKKYISRQEKITEIVKSDYIK